MGRRSKRITRLNAADPRHDRSQQPTRTLWFARSVLAEIALEIGVWRAERGGMLGGDLETGVVRHFHYDAGAHRTRGSYTPDHEELTRVLRDDWNPVDVRLLGFVHSHPPGLIEPSYGDVDYAQDILDHIADLPYLVMPIVRTARDGKFRVFPYVIHRAADRDDPVEECRFGLVDDEPRYGLRRADEVDEEVDEKVDAAREDEPRADEEPHSANGRNGHTVQGNGYDPGDLGTAVAPEVAVVSTEPPRPLSFPRPLSTEPIVGPGYVGTELEPTFQRVTGAYDLPLLSESRVVAVGAGGAATFLEELARAGVGEFVLVDPDVVSESNLATQQTYRRDVGRPKVEAIRDRIADVNPRAIVLPIQRSLDDLDDTTVARLCGVPLRHYLGRVPTRWGPTGTTVPIDLLQRPKRTLLTLLTDSFPAQARGNRLALTLGLPYLAAQVYAEGRGAEIVFSEPSVTPACTRCALRSRYEAYLENSFENDVTSDGTPIFATGRLNALKGFLALALLHHGSNHPRWGDLLTRIGKRNLVQIRMHPDARLPAFEKALAAADRERVLFDEAVWLPQEPDGEATGYPPCPDCGGTGDLRDAIGTIDDTRLPRRDTAMRSFRSFPQGFALNRGTGVALFRVELVGSAEFAEVRCQLVSRRHLVNGPCDAGLLQFLQAVPDPRGRRGRRHSHVAILAALVCAQLCGHVGLDAAAAWVRNVPRSFWHALGGWWPPPCANAFGNLLRVVDPESLETALLRWIERGLELELDEPDIAPNGETQASESSAIVVDGKVLRGTRTRHARATLVIAALDRATGCVCSQAEVDPATNESTAAIAFLQGLVLENRVVVADAAYCRRKVCETIHGGGGDYLVIVKENEANLLRDARLATTVTPGLSPLGASPCA